MEEAADKMFTATADYVRTELNATLDEYQLLQKMNRAALTKYRDLTQTTQAIGVALEALEGQHKELAPILAQIDNIEESVNSLEQAVYKLDAHCKQLEQKFKSLENK
ncbi:biogenesis of lysosome-related organelles complex 1 subunit 2-like [Tropilaelaps mercedesae]|uniref:Biogenesis of lysosome-related organelles complex 1 subunit 2-like n=1 Tax=Tropilaelaps mercedesae TaxID=418985 RepID=A0A1V9XB01_9ACAR|nr:biogenesis of lysosome-related organelles complex 1 subunit 2-like [Tropilaelaps mercedesae]